MQHLQTFIEEALTEYPKLPEETNELYTRRHFRIDLGGIAASCLKDDETVLERFHKKVSAITGILFDAVIGNSSVLIRNNDKNRIKAIDTDTESYSELLPKKLYTNSEDKYVAFINANSRKALLVRIEDDAKASMKLLFANVNESLATQVIIDIGKNASLKLFEFYASDCSSGSLSGTTHEIHAGQASSSEIDVIHNEGTNTAVLNNFKANVGERGILALNYVYTGGITIRSRNRIDALGDSSEIKVNELAFGSKEQRFDINTEVVNSARNTVSKLGSRVAMMQYSSCYLKGFAKMTSSAKNGVSLVEEHGMLIDKTARLDTLPSMSINENAVKAAHSSATGPIDEELLFYLMSRAIDGPKAKQLLISGFFSPLVGSIKSDLTKAVTSSLISEKIRDHGTFGLPPRIDTSSIIWMNRPEDKQ